MLTIQLDTIDVQDAFDTLVKSLQDTSPLMQRLSHVMLTSVLENFEQGGRPNKWKHKYDDTPSKLTQTSRLKGSINRVFDSASAVVGTNVEYAAIHHFGGAIKPKRAKALRFGGRFAKQVTIPARPFLVLTDSDLEEIEYTTQDYLRHIID